MSSLVDGFLEAAKSPKVIGGVVGGAAGLAIPSGSWLKRITNAGVGASVGMGLGSGAQGLLEDVDTSDLTPEELAVLREEEESAKKWRVLSRIMAAGTGIGASVVSASPVPAVLAIPGATVGPVGADAAVKRRAIKRFRDARRKG